MPEISLVLSVNPGTVWRVGFRPEPWAWSDWKHATDEDRFNGRWDDINGHFRTVYAGQSLFTCLIEVLAKYRRDTHLADTLKDIAEDPADAIEFPARAPAAVSYRWLEDRCASSAMLQGIFCITTAADTIATWLYRQTEPAVDGIEFTSRHGDDLKLWAVFERPSADSDTSPLLTKVTSMGLFPRDSGSRCSRCSPRPDVDELTHESHGTQKSLSELDCTGFSVILCTDLPSARYSPAQGA